ncbi:hypothetical protein RSSM_03203 [Rhodopirellula sallentina SM41]|uniref:Uncharacterized protein n=1 Tax=Rhodopirellula sallentina SM41 TaxID=1263870 RepID=M5UC08_9BACT|nr:hypothetical protein RSSM_03203 [Rhodopirellula sallentina SM41]
MFFVTRQGNACDVEQATGVYQLNASQLPLVRNRRCVRSRTPMLHERSRESSRNDNSLSMRALVENLQQIRNEISDA